MARILLNRSTKDGYIARIRHLREDTPRKWGSLDATRMLRHLRFVFQLTFDETKEKDASWPILRDVIYFVFFEWFTNWPKGKIKAPVSFTPEAEGSFETERELVLSCIERFVDALEASPRKTGMTPLLGPTPYHRWEKIHGAHLNHHLKQFGL
ncbi:MAG: DUF1569 domain-containing protein [Candidatus Hydrogenedentes bacterium]|nr:DUF1569 domain-containing protein [Candidatus Hydrogenedentota bacterium]